MEIYYESYTLFIFYFIISTLKCIIEKFPKLFYADITEKNNLKIRGLLLMSIIGRNRFILLYA